MSASRVNFAFSKDRMMVSSNHVYDKIKGIKRVGLEGSRKEVVNVIRY